MKCALERLRYSSERARQLANMGQAQRLPWTHEGLDGWLRKGQYEDLSTDAPPDEDKTNDDPEGLEDGSSVVWEHETRQDKSREIWRCSRVHRVASARPRGEAVLSQTVENFPMRAEQPVRKVSKNPPKSCSFPEHGQDEQCITSVL